MEKNMYFCIPINSVNEYDNNTSTNKMEMPSNYAEYVELIRQMSDELKAAGRYDVLLKAIGVPTLQQLNIEAAKASLSRLIITDDFRLQLPDYGKEIELTPIHKAVYILFLRHPEGIEFKRLSDFRSELHKIYSLLTNSPASDRINDTIERLVNPFDNAINEKCSRIKATLKSMMDSYQSSYYVISGHSVRHIDGSDRIWFERKKTITLPRHLVTMPDVLNSLE